MKYMYQFMVILMITFVSETLNHTINLPIPASIYGLVLMLILLITKVIKVEKVRDTAKYLIAIMQIMFIPAAVAIMNTWSDLGGILVPLVTISISSTIVVFVVTGKVSDLIIDRSAKK